MLKFHFQIWLPLILFCQFKRLKLVFILLVKRVEMRTKKLHIDVLLCAMREVSKLAIHSLAVWGTNNDQRVVNGVGESLSSFLQIATKKGSNNFGVLMISGHLRFTTFWPIQSDPFIGNRTAGWKVCAGLRQLRIGQKVWYLFTHQRPRLTISAPNKLWIQWKLSSNCN